MRCKGLFLLIVLAFVFTGCSNTSLSSNPNPSSSHIGIEPLNNSNADSMKKLENSPLEGVVMGYFKGFNNVYEWSKYSTEEYVRQVYMWCTGEDTEGKSREEVVKLYASLERAHLIDYQIVSLNPIDDKSYELEVDRNWENGDADNTTYSIIRIGDSWKFDDRY